jgi:hypothetical protein
VDEVMPLPGSFPRRGPARSPRSTVPTSAAVALAALAVAMGPLSGTGRSEDDRVVEQESSPASIQAPQQHLIDLGSNFDANLFEQQGNGWVLHGENGGLRVEGQVLINGRMPLRRQGAAEDRPPESPTFARARIIAERKLTRIDDACELSPEQRRKLRLAIESDIRRFAADVDAVRDRYAGVRVNLNDQEGQKRWHQFQQDVQQCRQRLRGLGDADSLFAKVLATTLEDRQLAGIESERRARRSFRWRAMVEATLARLDDMLGLDQKQHELVERMLIAREPALRIDESVAQQENDHLRTTLVYMVLSGSDMGRLKAAVSERQWRTLALLMNQGKSMRSWIEQQGILETPAP